LVYCCYWLGHVHSIISFLVSHCKKCMHNLVIFSENTGTHMSLCSTFVYWNCHSPLDESAECLFLACLVRQLHLHQSHLNMPLASP
jgi:hypothetical protein